MKRTRSHGQKKRTGAQAIATALRGFARVTDHHRLGRTDQCRQRSGRAPLYSRRPKTDDRFARGPSSACNLTCTWPVGRRKSGHLLKWRNQGKAVLWRRPQADPLAAVIEIQSVRRKIRSPPSTSGSSCPPQEPGRSRCSCPWGSGRRVPEGAKGASWQRHDDEQSKAARAQNQAIVTGRQLNTSSV